MERRCGKLVDSRRVAARSAIRCLVLPASRPPPFCSCSRSAMRSQADIGVISVTPARAHPGQLVTVVAGAYKQFPRMPLYLVTRARVRPPHPCSAGALCDPVLPRPPRRAPYPVRAPLGRRSPRLTAARACCEDRPNAVLAALRSARASS